MAVKHFMYFCGGSDVWNTTQFETSSWPEFTECFRHTIVTWIPCGFLILILPFYLCALYKNSKSRAATPKIPQSYLSVTKLILCMVLAAVETTSLIDLLTHSNTFHPASVDIMSASLKVATFLIAGLMTQTERIRGVHSSWILFLFWLLLAFAGIIPFYSKIILQQYVDKMFLFVLYYISYGLILIQFILHCFSEETPVTTEQAKEPCPVSKASVLSHLYFCWMNSLVVKACRQTLQEKDLWSLVEHDQSKYLSPSFDKEWIKEVNRTKTSNSYVYQDSNGSTSCGSNNCFTSDVNISFSEKTPLLGSNNSDSKTSFTTENSNHRGKPYHDVSLIKVLWKLQGLTFLKYLCFKFVSDVLQFVNPILLGVIIDYADNKETLPKWRGFMPAIGMFVCILIQSACSQQNYFYCLSVGMRIKSILTAAIYKKALTMDNEVRKGMTLGETINLMSVDCQRIQNAFTFLWAIMTVTVQTFLGIYFLWGVVGPSCLAGLAVLVLLIPFNAWVAVKQRKQQERVLKLKGKRIKLMNELLSGIKVLKMYAWELLFQEKAMRIRDKEIKKLKLIAYLQGTSSFCWILTPFLVMLATFTTYVFVSETHYLRPADAFVALSLFNILRVPINLLSMLISNLVQAYVSLKRIQTFLCGNDLDTFNIRITQEGENAVKIKHGTFTWDKTLPQATLRDIDVSIKEGQLVAIVGQVGSGKSSVISAMLGEMSKLQGSVTVKGKVAYVPQEAWIQNATLQDNILFGKQLLNKKYQRVVDACALTADLDILPGRDQTEIGEKGINISGGQKQRVSLARAVYSNSDIYLMDDPLSAVDSHVGKHIFNKVLGQKGLLKNKTRVLVTHGIHWLPVVDNILVMANGRISEMGSYEELISHDGPFAQFLRQYFLDEEELESDAEEEDQEIQQIKNKIFERVENVTSEGTATSDEKAPTSSNDSLRRLAMRAKLRKEQRTTTKAKTQETMAHVTKLTTQNSLTQIEASELGNVRISLVCIYIRAVGILATITVFTVFTCYHATSIFANYWLTFWTEDPFLTNSSNSKTQEYADTSFNYLTIYAILGAVQAILVLVYGLLVCVRMVHAAWKLHGSLLANILRCPMSFFDTTPIGRILNRFSSDVDAMDNSLPISFRITINSFFLAASTIIVISVNTAIFLTVVTPVIVLYFIIMKFYFPTSRQLKRLESVSRSPVYNHFSETVTGASVIRAYKVSDRFIDEVMTRIDTNQTYYFANFCSSSWLGIRLELLGNCLILTAALFGIFSSLNGALVGLSIAYALQATSELNILVVSITDLQNNLVSVERIQEYATVPSEGLLRSDKRPTIQWPRTGKISFVAYKARYRPNLDLVLKGINAEIEHNEKKYEIEDIMMYVPITTRSVNPSTATDFTSDFADIGVVGRTGAGKSSLTLALFRLIEAASGGIIIDGVRIGDIGLHDLREKITILPQDPVLFSGSLRMNLDPFQKYTEDELWQSLEHAHLKEFAYSLPGQLDYECGEGGQNLSVGQRQLVCLARTLLKPTKILILDEATAAVDMQTDYLIQQTIHNEFQNCTVISIAHRLHTVLDYDRVMVMDNGLISEFDTPGNLLSNTNSIFYGMAKDAGMLTGIDGKSMNDSKTTQSRKVSRDAERVMVSEDDTSASEIPRGSDSSDDLLLLPPESSSSKKETQV